MKTILLLLLPLITLTNCLAQPAFPYTGPAKIVVSQLQEGIEKLEKSVAGGGSTMDADIYLTLVRKLADLKKRDAAFNTTEFESKLKSLEGSILGNRQKKETAKLDQHEQNAKMQKAGKLVYSLFHDSPSVDNGDMPTIENQLKVYNEQLAELLAMDRDLVKQEAKVNYIHMKKAAQVAEKELNEIDRRCREQTKPENAEREYYELLFFRDFWNASRKVFPDEPDFNKAYEYAVKLLAGLGSKENVRGLAAKSMENKVRDARLPAAVIKDAVLEKSFIDLFNKSLGEKLGATANKAVLLQDDWAILRNEISGIVTGRRRGAAIAYKKKDGKCYFFTSFYIEQEYVGGAFGSSKSSNMYYGGNEILCENVK